MARTVNRVIEGYAQRLVSRRSPLHFRKTAWFIRKHPVLAEYHYGAVLVDADKRGFPQAILRMLDRFDDSRKKKEPTA